MTVRVPPFWLRRGLLPLAIPLEAALAALFAASALLCALAWPLTSRRRAFRVACFGCVYMSVEVAVLAVCAWRWVQRVTRRRPAAWWADVHTALLGWALTVILGAAQVLVGFRVELQEPPETGALDGDTPVLVLARHGGPGDSFALVQLLIGRYRRRVRIVVKDILALDPALDVLLHRLGCVFLPRARGVASAGRLAAMAAAMGPRDALLLFPEGGNWTPGRRRRAIDRLRRGQPGRRVRVAEQLEHLLPPRAAGVRACLAARSDLEVVLVAHTGLEELVTLRQGWAHLPFEVPMSVRWWKAGTRPQSTDAGAVEEWLVTEWAIIEQWIELQVDQGRRLSPPGREPRRQPLG